MEGNQEGDKWLGSMLRRLPVTASDGCLDAETLGAWAEGALDASRVSALELHAADCPRCMGMLAAIARTTPAAAPPKPSWAPGHLLRWLVPLTAAATAIAIWVAVPDRPVTPVSQVQPVPAPQRSEPSSAAEFQTAERRANAAPEPLAPILAPETTQAPAPTESPAPADSLEKQSAPAAPRADADAQFRDEGKRERATLEAFGAPAAAPPPPHPRCPLRRRVPLPPIWQTKWPPPRRLNERRSPESFPRPNRASRPIP